MTNESILDQIWVGDLLNRREEASSIERFIESEISFQNRMERTTSLVLAIDAPYGRGKTWFLDRLARQLELKHPVAKIDAWSDDASDEPLTAFMAAIDLALAPYLSKSQKLRDRLASAKAAAFPIIGKLVTGAAVKGLTKMAGDDIVDDLGETFQEAVRAAKIEMPQEFDDSVRVAAPEILSKLGEEIESLVDRRGAAMLEAYRQRKKSRNTFRENMHKLVQAIGDAGSSKQPPLVVIIDELDRCRPNYAIKILEEIKHFFDIPNIVFIISLHRGQLSKSVCSVYGNSFDSDEYLRRFFSRKYDLKEASTALLVESLIYECSMDMNKMRFPETNFPVQKMENEKIISHLLADWGVSPRECFEIIDSLRIFINNWDNNFQIDGISVLSLIVKNARGDVLNFSIPKELGLINFSGWSYLSPNAANPKTFNASQYLSHIPQLSEIPLFDLADGGRGNDAAKNSAANFLSEERSFRSSDQILSKTARSYISEYTERVREVARFNSM